MTPFHYDISVLLGINMEKIIRPDNLNAPGKMFTQEKRQMALKIIGFLIKVIKLAIDTFVEKPVKVRRRVQAIKPNKKVIVVGAVFVGFTAVVFLLRWFLKPLPSGAKLEKEIRRLPQENIGEVGTNNRDVLSLDGF